MATPNAPAAAIMARVMTAAEQDQRPDPPMTPGKIAGAVIGAFIATCVALIIFGFLFFRWRRKRREKKARENGGLEDGPYYAERRISNPGDDGPRTNVEQIAPSKKNESAQTKKEGKRREAPLREERVREQGSDLVNISESLFAHQRSLQPHFPYPSIGLKSGAVRSSTNSQPEPDRPAPAQSASNLENSAPEGFDSCPEYDPRGYPEAANATYYDTTVSMDTDSIEIQPEPPSRQMTELYEKQLRESRRRRSSGSTLKRIINGIKQRRRSTPGTVHRTRGQDFTGDSQMFYPGTPVARQTESQFQEGWEMTRGSDMRNITNEPHLYDEPEQIAESSAQAAARQPDGQGVIYGRLSQDLNRLRQKSSSQVLRGSRSFNRADSQVRETTETEIDPNLPSAVYGPRVGSTDNFYGLPPAVPAVSAQPLSRSQERLKSPEIPEPMDIDQLGMANPQDQSLLRSSHSPPLLPEAFVDPMSIFRPTTASEKAHYTTRQIENSASPPEIPMSPPEVVAGPSIQEHAGPSHPVPSQDDEDYDEFLDIPNDPGRQSIESYDFSTTPATTGFSSTDPSSGRTPDTRTTASPSPFPTSQQIKVEPSESSSSPGLSHTQGPASQSPQPINLTCDECGRSFDQIHKLNHHKRYHDRKHECPYEDCDKKFGTKTHLDRHINDKHVKSKAFHCTVPSCAYFKGGKAFPRKDNWRRHMMKKHGANASSIDAMEEVAG